MLCSGKGDSPVVALYYLAYFKFTNSQHNRDAGLAMLKLLEHLGLDLDHKQGLLYIRIVHTFFTMAQINY